MHYLIGKIYGKKKYATRFNFYLDIISLILCGLFNGIETESIFRNNNEATCRVILSDKWLLNFPSTHR